MTNPRGENNLRQNPVSKIQEQNPTQTERSIPTNILRKIMNRKLKLPKKFCGSLRKRWRNLSGQKLQNQMPAKQNRQMHRRKRHLCRKFQMQHHPAQSRKNSTVFCARAKKKYDWEGRTSKRWQKQLWFRAPCPMPEKAILQRRCAASSNRTDIGLPPFKSQNMALNSFITEEGLEMGRAQVMQAEAAGIKPFRC